MAETIVTLAHPYEDYDVYSDGKVYSRKRDKFIKPFLDRNGYLMVRLYDRKGGRVEKSLARMVAEIFVSPPSPYHSEVVIHKNYNKSDCRAENLEWRSRAYARRYADQEIIRDSSDVLNKRVSRYRPSSNSNPQPFGTIRQAAEEYGLLYTEVFNTASAHQPVYTIPDLGFVLTN